MLPPWSYKRTYTESRGYWAKSTGNHGERRGGEPPAAVSLVVCVTREACNQPRVEMCLVILKALPGLLEMFLGDVGMALDVVSKVGVVHGEMFRTDL